MPVKSHPTSFDKNGYVGKSNGHVGSATTLDPAEENELAMGLRMIRRRKGVFGGVAIAVTLAFWGWTLTRTPIYRGEFRVLVEPVTASDPSQQLLKEANVPLAGDFDYSTQIEVLRSPALLEPIAEQLQASHTGLSYGALLANLQVTRLRDTKVLSVSFLDQDPDRIQMVLEELSQSFLDYSFEQRQSSLQQGIQFVDGQLPELRDRVDSLQSRLERFRQEYSLIDPETRGGELSEFISDVEKQRQETQTALTEAQSLYSSLQSQLGFNDRQALAASSLSESPRYQALLTQLRELETKIATESSRFQSDSPNILVLQDERASLLPMLDLEAERVIQSVAGSDPGGVSGELTPTSLDLTRQLVKTANQVRQLETRSDALARVEGNLKQEFAVVPALARQYTDLQRELAVATDSLNRFLATRETLQIDAAQKSVPWELIAAPAVSAQPVSPNVPRNLMLGAIAGLALGALAAIIADKLDRVIHSADEIKALTSLPILGMVPLAQEEKELQLVPPVATARSRSTGTASVADVPSAPSRSAYTTSPFSESFRSLYTNLRFLSSDTPIRSVVISSPSPVEGKSTMSTHLAKAAAAMGQRVLLVDADLRCPKIHERLKLSNLRGLSDVLTGNADIEKLVRPVDGEPFLHVLTAGPVPPDPTKLLSSRRMQSLIERFQGSYNLIIYDMPPILGFADTPLLAAHADGMMLVTAIGKTRRADLLLALETVRLSPISLLGIIANGVQVNQSEYYNAYHYRYYQSQDGAETNGGPPTSLHPSLSQNLWKRSKKALSRLPETWATLPSQRILLISGIGTLIILLWVVQIFLAWRNNHNPIPSAQPNPAQPPASPTVNQTPEDLLDPFRPNSPDPQSPAADAPASAPSPAAAPPQ